MKADAKTEKEVLAVLEQMRTSYEKRRLDDLLSLFVQDPSTVVIGSGADEEFPGPAAIEVGLKRDWAQSESVSMEFREIMVSAAGSAAWLSSHLIMRAKVVGKDITLSARLTAVLVRQQGKWLFTQMHMSLPSAEQAPGQSFPTQPR